MSRKASMNWKVSLFSVHWVRFLTRVIHDIAYREGLLWQLEFVHYRIGINTTHNPASVHTFSTEEEDQALALMLECHSGKQFILLNCKDDDAPETPTSGKLPVSTCSGHVHPNKSFYRPTATTVSPSNWTTRTYRISRVVAQIPFPHSTWCPYNLLIPRWNSTWARSSWVIPRNINIRVGLSRAWSRTFECVDGVPVLLPSVWSSRGQVRSIGKKYVIATFMKLWRVPRPSTLDRAQPITGSRHSSRKNASLFN